MTFGCRLTPAKKSRPPCSRHTTRGRKFMKWMRNDRKAIFQHFDSTDEWLAMLKNTPAVWPARNRGSEIAPSNKSWDLEVGTGHAPISKLISLGWPEGRKKISKAVMEIQAPGTSETHTRRNNRMAAAGSRPVVPVMLAGVPEHIMLTPSRKQFKWPVVCNIAIRNQWHASQLRP